jgi:predicted MFS family arabinose efflux permease
MLGVSDQTSFNLILIINGLGVPGRLIPALIADRLMGPVNTFIPVLFVSGICLLSWAAVTNETGITIFVIFYGFFGGGTQSLLQAALASLNPDLKKAGVRIGMGFSVVSVASLTGSPIGGALIEQGHGYLNAQIFAGVTMIAGGLVLIAARISKTGLQLQARV